MTATTEQIRRVKVRPNYDHVAWKWMRYSALLLVPLVWFHLILQDVIVGVHAMDLDYVAQRWANIGWRIYDALLLQCALKAKADVIYTWNLKHFQQLAPNIASTIKTP